MITRIELHNFMSHRVTVIEPSPGLTVLVGPNNCGKSAVVGALQILCHNENSTYVKRHGAKECAVVVHTDEGHVLEWRRKGSPRYLINGTEHGRLGNSGVPAELHSLLRLPLVADDDDDSFNVHFGNQKSPIFLLNSRAGAAAKFFAASSDAIRLLEMQQRHREKVIEARRQHKQLEAESVVVGAELAALEATVPLAERLAELEAWHARLGRIEAAIVDLGRCTLDLVERSDRVELHVARSDALRPLARPPVLEDPQPLATHIDQLIKMRGQLDRLVDEAARLVALSLPPELHDVSSLERLVESLDSGSTRIDRLSRCGQVLDVLQPLPALPDSIALEALVHQLARSEQDTSSSSARCDRLSGLTRAPELVPAKDLASVLDSIEQQTRQFNKLREAAAVTSTLAFAPDFHEETPLQADLQHLMLAESRCAEFQASLGLLNAESDATAAVLREAVQGQSCPTCGQPFDADQLMSMGAGGKGGHAHG